MMFLLFSLLAFACNNAIDTVDVEKIIAGQPHGKTFLKCTSEDCICWDGVGNTIMAEYAKIETDRSGKKKLVVDVEKKTVWDIRKASEKLAREEKKERLETVKSRIIEGTATLPEKDEALRLLLEKMEALPE